MRVAPALDPYHNISMTIAATLAQRSIPAAFFVLLAASCHAQVSGRVLSESGEPISGASVISVREGETGYLAKNETNTDKAGKFRLASRGSVLLTTQPGFIPDFHPLAAGEGAVVLTLKPLSAEPPISFLACPSKAGDNDYPIGFSHRIPIGNAVPVRSKHGIDTVDYTFSFPGHENEVMTVWSGMYAFQWPRLDVLPETTMFSARGIEDSPNAEMRGTLKNGDRWRWIWMPSGAIDYYDVSPEAADFFDQLINQTCTIPAAPPSDHPSR